MLVKKYEVIKDFICSDSLYLKGDILYIGEYIEEHYYLTAKPAIYELVRIFKDNSSIIQTIGKTQYMLNFTNNIELVE